MKERPADQRPIGRRKQASFDAALRSDAGRIRADVTAGFERRIEAALAHERPRAVAPERRQNFAGPWLAGSLAGLGAAAMIVLLVGRSGEDTRVPPAAPAQPLADVSAADRSSELLRSLRAEVPLNVETAELTAPLAQELENLRSDLEKARENVERDLGLRF